MNARPGLSIIIPAYNEEQRLPRTLECVRGYLRGERAGTEVIVVDDGSSDGTAELVERMRAEMPELRLVSNGQNRGKGYSVRHGMLEARGRVALFTDADLSAPIEEAGKLLEALEAADVAIGSRALDRSLIEVHQSKARELAGILFNWMVRLFTGVRFQDTVRIQSVRDARSADRFRAAADRGFRIRSGDIVSGAAARSASHRSAGALGA